MGIKRFGGFDAEPRPWTDCSDMVPNSVHAYRSTVQLGRKRTTEAQRTQREETQRRELGFLFSVSLPSVSSVPLWFVFFRAGQCYGTRVHYSGPCPNNQSMAAAPHQTRRIALSPSTMTPTPTAHRRSHRRRQPPSFATARARS